MTIRALIGEAGLGKVFRDLMFPGVAGIAIAISLGFFELLKQNPTAATDLLKAWGPGFLLGMLAIAVVGGFLGQMVDAQKDSVEAQKQVAIALTTVAEKDDRERDRMATETAYMAQRVDRTLGMVEGIARQHLEFGKQQIEFGKQLERIESRIANRVEARIEVGVTGNATEAKVTDLKGAGG